MSGSDGLAGYLDQGSTIRGLTPEETLARVEPLYRSLGITRVANVTGLDNVGIPVALCIRPNSRHLSTSQGKGTTFAIACVSAVMESIEMFHAENPPTPDLWGSYKDLSARHEALDPGHLTPGYFVASGERDRHQAWIKAVEIGSGRPLYVPQFVASMDTSTPSPQRAFAFVSSNGLASGNFREEAICHGLCEVIERDALYRWERLGAEERMATRVNPSSVDCAINQELIAQFRRSRLDVQIWDITSPLEVPAFRCAIQDRRGIGSLGTFLGSGAHLSKSIALARALTEAAQSRVTVISGSRDDVFPNIYQQRRIIQDATRPAEEGLFGRDYRTIRSLPTQPSFRDNVSDLMARLASRGFTRVIVIDHTKADLGIPVVQVLVPGLHLPAALR